MADGGPLDLGTELVPAPEDEAPVETDDEVDADADQLRAAVAADPTAPRPGS